MVSTSFPGSSVVKNLSAMQETLVVFLSWIALLEEGMATPTPQYSCLKDPMDRGAWRATVLRVAQSDTTDY